MRLTADQNPMKSYVFFGVFEFGDDIGTVTEIMGIEPTEAWLKGESYQPNQPHPKARRTHSRWKLSSGLDTSDPVETHLDSLLTKLESLREGVTKCTELYRTCIWIAIYSRDANSSFRIESRETRRIAELGISIDIDFYRLPESK